MTLGEAVQRINEAIGFRAAGNNLEATIIRRIGEAQRNMENGKTLPRFLLRSFEILPLLTGTSQVTLPAGFIREHDDGRLFYYGSPTTTAATVLTRVYSIDAWNDLRATGQDQTTETGAPTMYTFFYDLNLVTFWRNADKNYDVFWNYYFHDAVLTDTSATNQWLTHAPEWLIGEAGLRIARTLRDADAVAEFTAMRDEARSAVFGEEVVAELASAPLVMGGNL